MIKCNCLYMNQQTLVYLHKISLKLLCNTLWTKQETKLQNNTRIIKAMTESNTGYVTNLQIMNF